MGERARLGRKTERVIDNLGASFDRLIATVRAKKRQAFVQRVFELACERLGLDKKRVNSEARVVELARQALEHRLLEREVRRYR
jgi:hypothetical protein